MNLCEKVPQGCWHMCTIYHTNMNCEEWHNDVDPNLMKMKKSGELSKVKELHQVETSLEPRRL